MAKIVTMLLLVDVNTHGLDRLDAINEMMTAAQQHDPRLIDFAYSEVLNGGDEVRDFDYDPSTYRQGDFIDVRHLFPKSPGT